MISDPDGSYIIKKPVGNWSISSQTFKELVSENLQLKEPFMMEQLTKNLPDINCLKMAAERKISIIPIPGITKVDGRKIPTSLEMWAAISLTIMPIERFQPPFYSERPLLHNFFQFVTRDFLNASTLRDLKMVTIPNTQRSSIIAEFSQKL